MNFGLLLNLRHMIDVKFPAIWAVIPFVMRSPMQRKYAAEAAHGGASSRENLPYSIE